MTLRDVLAIHEKRIAEATAAREAEALLRKVSAASDARPEPAAYPPGFYDLTRLTKAPRDDSRAPSETGRKW